MGLLRISFWALLGLCLVTVGLANMTPVQLQVLPPQLAAALLLDFSATLPLALVIYGSVIAGLLLGFVWEWFREYPQRAELDQSRREAARLRMELARLRADKHQGDDRLLAKLDETL